MQKDVVELNRPQMAIQYMHFSCLITKATDMLRICNTYCFSMATVVTQTHLSVIFTHTVPVSCYIL
jgi:hypothetical protein